MTKVWLTVCGLNLVSAAGSASIIRMHSQTVCIQGIQPSNFQLAMFRMLALLPSSGCIPRRRMQTVCTQRCLPSNLQHAMFRRPALLPSSGCITRRVMQTLHAEDPAQQLPARYVSLTESKCVSRRKPVQVLLRKSVILISVAVLLSPSIQMQE